MEITMHDDQLITHQNSGGLMTDEQIEVLRKQICVYSIICEQLVDLHKAMTTQHEIVAGANLGNLYCDSLITYAGQKFTSRHRWTPTTPQLQILESLFLQGNGTPSKQKIKEMTTELSQHGQISETNVYNWFQNRRARSKRKKLPNVAPNIATTDSQVEEEKEKCSKEKTKVGESGRSVPEKSITPRDSDASYFHNPEFHSLVAQYYNENPPFPSDLSFKPYEAFGHLDLHQSVKGSNQMINKMGD